MFEVIISFVLEREGGYVNNPNDSGGATNKGITQDTYNTYRGLMGLPVHDVRNITMYEVMDIYRRGYWKDEWQLLGFPLAACMFDTTVNMGRSNWETGPGVGRAQKFLDRCGGSYITYLQLRIERYKEIIANNPSQKVFERGWFNRVTHLRRFIDEQKDSYT